MNKKARARRISKLPLMYLTQLLREVSSLQLLWVSGPSRPTGLAKEPCP
jgi:hypothetical protein